MVASVAQLVEQLTLNQLVVGSNPPRGTTFVLPAPSGARARGAVPIFFERFSPALSNDMLAGSSRAGSSRACFGGIAPVLSLSRANAPTGPAAEI